MSELLEMSRDGEYPLLGESPQREVSKQLSFDSFQKPSVHLTFVLCSPHLVLLHLLTLLDFEFLRKDTTYLFEMYAHGHEIVTKYESERIFLIGGRNFMDGTLLGLNELDELKMKVVPPSSIPSFAKIPFSYLCLPHLKHDIVCREWSERVSPIVFLTGDTWFEVSQGC